MKKSVREDFFDHIHLENAKNVQVEIIFYSRTSQSI